MFKGEATMWFGKYQQEKNNAPLEKRNKKKNQ